MTDSSTLDSASQDRQLAEIDALGDTSTLADPSVVDNLIENRANK